MTLREKRAKAIADARALLNKAEQDGRDLSTEEQTQYDNLVNEAEGLRSRIEREERLTGMEADMGRSQSQPVHTRTQPASAEIGMSDKEVRQYSLVRAIRSMAAAMKGDHRAMDEAGLEMEASRAVAQQLGRQPQGFFLPYDWQRASLTGEQRDLNRTTATAGGNTVSTDLLAQSFIELLRNRMVVRQAGATVLSGLVGDIAIPRQTGGATAYWVAESGAPTESQQTIDQVPMAPKTVGAFTDISRKLLLQSSIDVEQFVRGDLSSVLALALDLAGLHGTGQNNQPTGVAGVSGIGSVVGGDNGLAPAWSHIVGLETEVAIDNADVGKLAYITNAKVRGKLKQTAKVSSTDSVMVWGEGSTPLNGYGAYVTNQVSSGLTKGTADGVCSGIFFGNWADLVIGLWGGLDILVDPYTGGTSGTVRVIALQDADIAVRHAQSFAAMLDALTA